MKDGKLIDFDAWRAEQEPDTAEPKILRIGGRDITLRPSLPATVALAALRAAAE